MDCPHENPTALFRFIALNAMTSLAKVLFAGVALAALSACGGGDTASRLDLANPTVRFVHAAAGVPAVTLSRAGVAQSDSTNVPYQYVSNYSDIDMSTADWSVATVGAVPVAVGQVSIPPVRGNKYTVVALDGAGTLTRAILIVDPYNKSLTSDSARLRVVNASPNAPSIDVYMTAVGADLTPVSLLPNIAATLSGQPGPASGTDSVDIPGGTVYQVTVTTAATKTMLFKGALGFAPNQDILLVAVPDPLLPNQVAVFFKIEGSNGSAAVPGI